MAPPYAPEIPSAMSDWSNFEVTENRSFEESKPVALGYSGYQLPFLGFSFRRNTRPSTPDGVVGNDIDTAAPLCGCSVTHTQPPGIYEPALLEFTKAQEKLWEENTVLRQKVFFA